MEKFYIINKIDGHYIFYLSTNTCDPLREWLSNKIKWDGLYRQSIPLQTWFTLKDNKYCTDVEKTLKNHGYKKGNVN